MTREEAIKELERISEDTVQRDCSTCGRPTAGIYNGVCCYCSLCQVVPEIFKDYHERKHFRSYWKWNGRWKNEAIGMAISALREQPRWISVEERLPEDDLSGDSERLVLKVLVVIRADNGRYTIRTETRERRKYYTAKRFGKWFWGKGYKGAITHWMPLPEPPTEEEV